MVYSANNENIFAKKERTFYRYQNVIPSPTNCKFSHKNSKHQITSLLAGYSAFLKVIQMANSNV